MIADAAERPGSLSGQLPSADELAAEVERFLAGHDGPDGDTDRRDDPTL